MRAKIEVASLKRVLECFHNQRWVGDERSFKGSRNRILVQMWVIDLCIACVWCVHICMRCVFGLQDPSTEQSVLWTDAKPQVSALADGDESVSTMNFTCRMQSISPCSHSRTHSFTHSLAAWLQSFDGSCGGSGWTKT